MSRGAYKDQGWGRGWDRTLCLARDWERIWATMANINLVLRSTGVSLRAMIREGLCFQNYTSPNAFSGRGIYA